MYKKCINILPVSLSNNIYEDLICTACWWSKG